MARNIITGIDVGTSTIKVVIAEQKSNGQINILGSGKKTSHGIRKGYVANFEEASENIRGAIKNAEKMAGIQVKRAYVAAGGITLGSVKVKETMMISRADGEVTDNDLKRIIAQSEDKLPGNSNKQIIHTTPIGFKIDGNPSLGNPVGMRGAKLEVEMLFITCLNQHIIDLVKAVESAGVAINDVVPSPLAASFIALSKHQKEVGCVLINLGAGTVSIVVFEEGLPISLEVFPIGSTHITNDIALGLQVPLEEAEKLKVDYGSDLGVPKHKLSNIVEARLNDIFELIESHLKKINRDGLLPAGIILTGGGSGLVSLGEIAKASLRLPAKVGSNVHLQNHDNLSVSNSPQNQILNNPEWSVALGLCLMEFNNETVMPVIAGAFLSKVSSAIKKSLRSFLP